VKYLDVPYVNIIHDVNKVCQHDRMYHSPGLIGLGGFDICVIRC